MDSHIEFNPNFKRIIFNNNPRLERNPQMFFKDPNRQRDAKIDYLLSNLDEITKS